MIKHNDKWVLDKVKLVIPELPAGFMVNAGIYYLSTILDKDVGEEIVLY